MNWKVEFHEQAVTELASLEASERQEILAFLSYYQGNTFDPRGRGRRMAITPKGKGSIFWLFQVSDLRIECSLYTDLESLSVLRIGSRNQQSQWVFAYGSNMDFDGLCKRLTEKGFDASVISQPCRATLPDYELIWNYYSKDRWKAGAANIQRADGKILPGVAFKATNLSGINAQEGYPHVYETLNPKPQIELSDGTKVPAVVYIVQRKERLQTSPVWPTQNYIDMMIEGAKKYDLPKEHIEQLELWKTEAQKETTK